MTRQRLIILVAALAVAAIIGLALAPKVDRLVDNAGPNGEAGANVQSVGKPRVGGPFTLVDQTGKTVTDKDFQGKFMLIYFGFTFCPDVCPTELQAISAALEKLGDKVAKVQPIFVSVDPDRDTPQVLAKYVKQFDPRLIGLTGSAEQIAAVAKAYRVFYEKVKEQPADGSKAADDDYTVDHSSVAYLMGPNGEFLTFFPPGVTPDQMAQKIASYL